MRKIFMLITLFFFCLVTAGKALAQGDGPRAYLPVPVGTNILTSFWLGLDTNRGFDDFRVVPDAEFDTDVFTLMYTRTFSVAGNLGGIFAVLPTGRVEGGFPGTVLEGKSSGLADVHVGMTVALFGAPAYGPKEFLTYKPETALSVLAGFSAPTGKYNSDKVINLGANRWAFRLGLPFLHTFGWGPGKISTLELNPNVWFFTDNNDPRNADRLEQKPVFKLEGHVTHDFSLMFWGSLDALYTLGGETKVDGVDQDNSQSSLALGATLGVNLSRAFGFQATYGKIVDRNENGMDGNMWRVKFSYVF